MATSAELHTALREAGALRLPPDARAWLLGRVRRHGWVDGARNLGGLRCPRSHDHASDGGCLAVGGAEPRFLATFPSVPAAARALVDVAGRASARYRARGVGEVLQKNSPAPGQYVPKNGPLPGGADPQQDEDAARAEEAAKNKNVADWLPNAIPGAEAEADYAGLRADWEAYEAAGVGTTILPDRHLDLAAWHAFRDAWEAGQVPGTEQGGQLRAQLLSAASLRSELCDAAPTSPPCAAPPQAPPDAGTLDLGPSTVQAADEIAKKHAWLDWLTNDPMHAVLAGLAALVGVPLLVSLASAGGEALGARLTPRAVRRSRREDEP